MASSYGSSTFARPPGIPTYQYHSPDGHSKWKGPRRVCIFCTMAIVVPSLLISIPLLMRFVIYGSSSYVIHPSDMRVLDERISTIWCEEETVRMNASFTAYVTNGEPNVFDTPTTLTVDQNMKIPDDQKEYWGLYLLPGSTFRVRTCARHKGGTFLIVRGNKHMKYCAYVGEADSAGKSDEVSDSTSVEVNARFRNGQVKFTVGNSKEIQRSHDDLTILSKLKSYLQTHPSNRDKLQKTLEDWMLLNSSSTENSTVPEIPVTVTALLQNETDAEPQQSNPGSLEHGVIHRSRRSIDVRPDTESGENGAFEDNSILEDEEPRKNLSVVDLKPFQTPDSIWKEQHNQHSGVLNDTLDPNDGSQSESESSFSSSEEALLKCEGVIASFTIPQEDECTSKGSYEDLNLTKNLPGLETNVYEFIVQEGDYYYFIFGSENEKYTNSIRAKFELQKMVYNLPEALKNCTDVMECQISFGFASSEKVVIKVPQPPPVNNNSSNLLYVVETECKPRAHLYLIFVILVPLVILIFAFQ